MSWFIQNVDRCAILADMGVGKTGSTLTALVDEFELLNTHRVLIVGPLRVAMKTWPDELAEWAHTRHLKFHFLQGTASKNETHPLTGVVTHKAGTMEKQIRKLMPTVQIWGISCDSVHNLAKLFYGRQHPWDWVIIDESSRFKNADAKRTRAMTLLTIHPRKVTLLTGTPAPNGLMDLWSQYYLLDRGKRLGHTVTAFKQRWFTQVPVKDEKTGRVDFKLEPNEFSKQQIMKAVADITYVLRPEDFGNAHRPKFNNIKLDLPAKLKQSYEEFKKEYILSLPEGEQITAQSAQGLGIKLLQFASGAIYDEEKNVKQIHGIKVEALKEIVEDNSGKPLLVAYNFIHEIDRIKHAFPHAEVFGKDPSQQDRWNRGEIEMMIAHPRSAAHGLNLQFGGHILIWFSFGYNLEEYLQMNKRLARKGQKNEVMVHHLIMQDTVDEIVMRSLTHKDAIQNSFQNELKELIKDVLKSARRKIAA